MAMSDLGHIDLLVRDGFYANRTDFIRTAIRNQAERHAEATRQSVSRRSLDLGLRHFGREELEAARAAQRPLDIRVLGLVTIAPDVHAGPRPRRYRLHLRARHAAGQSGGESRVGRPRPLKSSRARPSFSLVPTFRGQDVA